MRQRRALRQFTLSTGKSAGRNSSGRITVFHRGGGSKRLQRRIDLKRSTSSMGIVERIEYDPNRSSQIAPVRWIEGVDRSRQRKCNTIDKFAPPRKILERLISILVFILLFGFGVPVMAYCADDHPSSSFWEGLSAWAPEPGEEIHSQPSQGVGQRLPGSSSPGISVESLFRDLEQPSREPAPNIPPVQQAGPSNQPLAVEPSPENSGDSDGLMAAARPFLNHVGSSSLPEPAPAFWEGLPNPMIRDSDASSPVIMTAPAISQSELFGTQNPEVEETSRDRREESSHGLGEGLLSPMTRRDELITRYSYKTESALDPKPAFIEAQFQLELKLESALRTEGYTSDSIFEERRLWREAAFAKDTIPKDLSLQSLNNLLNKHGNNIKASASFKRILKGIEMETIRLYKSR